MPKNIGNFIGFSTDGWTNLSVRLPGIWNIFDQARNKRANRWPQKSGFSATGGTLVVAPTGTYHVFTSPGNFEVLNYLPGSTINVFIVAGGGGAANPLAAGGGGGGVVNHVAYPITSLATYPIVVGAGGAGSTASTPASGPAGSRGSDSSALSMTAQGGGGGGPYDGSVPAPSLAEMPGGSGGGGRTYTAPLLGGTGNQPTLNVPFQPSPSFSQYGNPGGGSPVTSDPQGRGGGGASSPGVSGPYVPGTVTGGNGQPFPLFAGPLFPGIYPVPVAAEIGPTGLYGGGGAAGSRNEPSLGGPGGGGDSGPATYGQFGTQYTGGGGGGGLYSPSTPDPAPPGENARGGAGIVIIKYN